ncbi:MAG: hypothetical protein P8X86_07440 [Desulfofustis sp.]
MTRLTIAYANHRPETLPLCQPLMEQHQRIILEEPPHPLFPRMIRGQVSTEDYLLDQDIEYPAFSQQQCLMLQSFFSGGIELLQVEPYIEHLIQVQDFFAEGNGPDNLDKSTLHYQVYLREKEATRTLIDFYQAVRGDDFSHLIESVKNFAWADARRFALRDQLRAQAIVNNLIDTQPTCVEAGPMHLLLYHNLRPLVPPDWSLKPVFVEHRGLQQLGLKSGLYGPGDQLTVHCLFQRQLQAEHADLLCARTLVFMKIVGQDEYSGQNGLFPHLRDEARAASLVNKLSFEQCRLLFGKIRDRSAAAAADLVREHLSGPPAKPLP